jgi:hypothetical protein
LKKAGLSNANRYGMHVDDGWIGTWMQALSEFNHPMLTTFKDIVDNINYNIKEYIDNTSNELNK